MREEERGRKRGKERKGEGGVCVKRRGNDREREKRERRGEKEEKEGEKKGGRRGGERQEARMR